MTGCFCYDQAARQFAILEPKNIEINEVQYEYAVQKRQLADLEALKG